MSNPEPDVRSAVYYPANGYILLDVVFPVALSRINACNLMYFYPDIPYVLDLYTGANNVTALGIEKSNDRIIQLEPNVIQVKVATSLLKRAPQHGDTFRYVSFDYDNSNSPTDNDVPVYIYGSEPVSASVSSRTNRSAVVAVSSTAPITAAPTVYNAADNTVYTGSSWDGSIILSNLTSSSVYSFYLNVPTVVGDISSNVFSVETYPDNIYVVAPSALPGSIALSVASSGVKNIDTISGGLTIGGDSGVKTYSVIRKDAADSTSDISGIVISNLTFEAEYSLTIAATNAGGVSNTVVINATSTQFPTIEVISTDDTTITIKPSYPSITGVQVLSDTDQPYTIDAVAYTAGSSDTIIINTLTPATSYTFKLAGTVGTKSGASSLITATTNNVSLSLVSVGATSAVLHIVSGPTITGTPTLYYQSGSVVPTQFYDASAQNITISNISSATQYSVYAIIPTNEGNLQTSSKILNTNLLYSTSSAQPAAVIVSINSSGIKNIASVSGYYTNDGGITGDDGDKSYTITRAVSGNATSDITSITITNLIFSANYTLVITMYNSQNVLSTTTISEFSGAFPTITATSITDTSVVLAPSYSGVSDPQVWNDDNVEYSVAIPGVSVDVASYTSGARTGILVSGLTPLTTYAFKLFGYVGVAGNVSPAISITTGDVGSGSSGSSGSGSGSSGSGSGAGSGTVPCIPAGQRILTQRGLVPVEMLRKGDQLATADGRLVDFKLYKTVLTACAEKNAPIRIERGATAVELSPLHMIQMRRGVWAKPAELLAAGAKGVSRVRAGEDVVYYHMEMPDYLRDNMVVEGCVVESFGLPWVHRSGFKGSPYTWNARLNGYTRIASWTAKPLQA